MFNGDIMKVWLRQFEITFISNITKQKMVISDYADGKNTISINITGTKCLTILKDEFTIEINNLTYLQILQLIDGQFYDVEIKVGYKNIGLHSVFKGGIIYISNNLGDRKTNTVIILCGSKFISAYGQSRLNYCLTSGVNMYQAISFLLNKSGIKNFGIDPSFKERILTETVNANSSVASWLDNYITQNQLVANVDYTTNNIVNIWDPFGKSRNVVRLNQNNILLTGGYPRLTSQGLELTILPTQKLSPGDIIEIDNSLINIPIRDRDDLSSALGIYLDNSTNVKDVIAGNTYGQYMIYEIEYNLQNRDADFSLKIIAKSRNLIKKLIGGK